MINFRITGSYENWKARWMLTDQGEFWADVGRANFETSKRE